MNSTSGNSMPTGSLDPRHRSRRRLLLTRSSSGRFRARPRIWISLWIVVFFVCCFPAQLLRAGQTPHNDPRQLDAITRLAAQKQWQAAATRIAEYRRRYPDSVPAVILQAEVLIHIGLLVDANDVIQRTLILHPRSIPALSAYAELSQKLGDKATAEQLLLRCTRYSPRDPATWKHLGDFYLSQGRKEALPSFQHALTLGSHDATALAGVAEAHHQQGADGAALRDFRQAVQWNESAKTPDAMVDFLFGEFLLDKTNYSESLKCYQRALNRDPSLTEARLGRAKSLLHLREWQRAESDLKVTAALDEWTIESLDLLIKVYQAEGKTTEAKDAASKAEQLSAKQNAEKASSNQIASSLQSAHALELQKDFRQAALAFQHLLQDHPEAIAAWLDLGRCYAELGQSSEAESALRHFVELQDNSASAHALLGKILLREEKIQEARREFARAQDIDPLSAEARLGIAASYMVERRFPDAIQVLRSAKSMPGSGIETRLMLTEALYKNGQRNAALKEINDAIREYPSNKEALAMRDSLLQDQH
jgi:tetratricopeptide (TPR) repeat protein